MLIVLSRCTALLAKHTALKTYGQCNCSTLIVSAMLLQESKGRIAALSTRLEEQQNDKAATVEVSAAQAAYCRPAQFHMIIGVVTAKSVLAERVPADVLPFGFSLESRVGVCTSATEGHAVVLEYEGCRVHKMMCAKDGGPASSVT